MSPLLTFISEEPKFFYEETKIYEKIRWINLDVTEGTILWSYIYDINHDFIIVYLQVKEDGIYSRSYRSWIWLLN